MNLFALLISVLFILYLFWRDLKESPPFPKALWIPFLWMVFAGSRYASQWLNLAPLEVSADVYSEGSGIDRVVFLLLILASVAILVRRKLNWSEFFKNNALFGLYFVFCGLSIFWADDSFVSFKRWIKLLGVICIALVILTEERPYEAFGSLLRRLAFLLLPLSIVFIKYFPQLGRSYSAAGGMMFTGVTLQKNSLGALCLITGIYFFWNLISNFRKDEPSLNRIHVLFIFIVTWVLYMSHSATSQACLLAGISIFVISRFPAVVQKPTRIINIGITMISLYLTLELFFDIKGTVIAMLGRAPDLTSRVPIWGMLFSMAKDPLLGAGYESFWSGNRMIQIWDAVGANIITAHNGYLDTYFEIGIVGLTIALISIGNGLRKVAGRLNTDYTQTVLRISIIVVFVLYNWTESAFIPINNLFLSFWVCILEPPTKLT